MHVMSVEQIQQLVSNNPDDRVLIAGLMGWMLTPLELAEVEVIDVVTQKGEIKTQWQVSDSLAHNDIVRGAFTADVFKPVLAKHLEHLARTEHGKGKTSAYAGARREAKFFLSDRNEPFAVSEKKEGRKAVAQGVIDRVKRMIKRAGLEREGITPSSLRVSMAYHMFRSVPGMTIVQIQKAFGHARIETTSSWVKPEVAEIERAQELLFRHVKWD